MIILGEWGRGFYYAFCLENSGLTQGIIGDIFIMSIKGEELAASG